MKVAAPSNIPLVATVPAWRLPAIRAAIKDFKRAQRREADDGFVERANARADRVMGMPIDTLPEAEAMLRLVLVSEEEWLKDAALTPLRAIAAVLAVAVKGGNP